MKRRSSQGEESIPRGCPDTQPPTKHSIPNPAGVARLRVQDNFIWPESLSWLKIMWSKRRGSESKIDSPTILARSREFRRFGKFPPRMSASNLRRVASHDVILGEKLSFSVAWRIGWVALHAGLTQYTSSMPLFPGFKVEEVFGGRTYTQAVHPPHIWASDVEAAR